MFDNEKRGLETAFAGVAEHLRGAAVPLLGLASEHFFDDVFWTRFERGEVLPYPGGSAILVELHPDRWPRGLAERFFQMQLRGIRPVLAHPERYAPLASETEPLDPLLDAGALRSSITMSLVGRYGDRPAPRGGACSTEARTHRVHRCPSAGGRGARRARHRAPPRAGRWRRGRADALREPGGRPRRRPVKPRARALRVDQIEPRRRRSLRVAMAARTDSAASSVRARRSSTSRASRRS